MGKRRGNAATMQKFDKIIIHYGFEELKVVELEETEGGS